MNPANPMTKIHNILITAIEADDINTLMHVETRAYPHPWTTCIMQDCLKSGYPAYKISLEQTIIAYGFISIAVGESHLLNLTVDPLFQRQGLGTKLLAHLLTVAEAHDAEEMFLEVRTSNITARKLYESMGFNEIAIRKNYYPSTNNTREDAIIMVKTLRHFLFSNE